MSLNSKIEWILGVIVILLTGILTTYYSYAENNPKTLATIVVDPGHGGYDPGKIGVNDALEKDINLRIATELEHYLEEAGFVVVMTRTGDDDLQTNNSKYNKTKDLEKRCQLMEECNADYAISIHQNSYTDSSVSGAQVFYYKSSREGEILAECIQEALRKELDTSNNRKSKNSEDYYILKNSCCPTVIVECGFLSNRTEANNLCDSNYQKKTAKAICDGFTAFFKQVHNE